jgi:putative peptidoglycan lipid II flippase
VGPLRGLGLAHRGLALATSVTSLLNLAQLAFRLRSKLGGVDAGRILRSLGRILVASAIPAAGLAAGLAALGDISGRGLAIRAAVVAGGGLGALVAGGLLMRLLRVEELAMLGELARSIRGRFRRG